MDTTKFNHWEILPEYPSAVASKLTTEVTVQKKTREPFTYQKE
jgi:hypothetical protein